MAQAVYGWIPVTLDFAAMDPRWHADDPQSLVLPLDVSDDSQGFKGPLVGPITTGVSHPSERPGWVLNGGDLPAWPTLRIDGPVQIPPGKSEMRWTATDYTNTCRLTLSWRDAYAAL